MTSDIGQSQLRKAELGRGETRHPSGHQTPRTSRSLHANISMWKRLNNAKGGRPAPVEPTFDQRYAGSHGLGVEVISPLTIGQKSSTSPRSPESHMESKPIPRLPFEPPTPPEHRSSIRPTSSIYSRPSSNVPVVTQVPAGATKRQSRRSYTEEVSPPSSPELGAFHQRSQNQEEDVSPIDEMPDASRLVLAQQSTRPDSQASKPPSSSIPVLRREKRRNQITAAAANLVTRKEIDGLHSRPAKNPSWDPYTGEPTTPDRGKKQSATPAQFTASGLRNTRSALGNETRVTAGPRNLTFGERVRKLKNMNSPTEPKPDWKGASGRATLVTPVEDRPELGPLSLPTKNERRGIAAPTPEATSQVSSRSPGNRASPQVLERDEPTIRSVLSDNHTNAPRVKNVPAPEPVINPVSSLRTQARANAPVEPRQPESMSTEEKHFREAYKHVEFGGNKAPEPYVQPPSRFSVSTYATTTTGAHSSPRQSTDDYERPPLPDQTPPMPTPPQQFAQEFAIQQPSPIMNRKKPKMSESPRSGVTRKAVAAPSSPVFISLKQPDLSKRVSNIAKSLPMSPAEAESHDLITSLQAQLDDLQHRRNNITKSIRAMTELMPTDHVILTDEVRRKRENEKLKVEGLREEEADIRRQEHEIGLRLHRAWKRRDREAEYEPTGLWVSRIAS